MEQREFPTGSRRDSRAGKGRYDLLPCRALRRLARHFETGAERYGDNNWLKGQPLSVFADSAIRHGFSRVEGMMNEDHTIAAAWNWLALAEIEERIKEGFLPKELDDLPRLVVRLPRLVARGGNPWANGVGI